MRIDLIRQEEWEELNEVLHGELGLSSKIGVRAYEGMAQAVYEIAQGTAQFMTHKRSVVFISGQSPAGDMILPYYYKETYNVRVLSYEELENSEEALTEFVNSLSADTVFVLVAEDHPVTGRKYLFVDKLNQLLSSKRILTLRLSYFNHYYNKEAPLPYTVRICSWGPSQSLALIGERFRSPNLFVQGMSWNKEEFMTSFRSSRNSFASEDESSIRQFEARADEFGAEAFFKNSEPRVFDRAALVFPDLNAEYLCKVLGEELALSEVEYAQLLDSTNLCLRPGTLGSYSWWKPMPRAEELRGLLLLSPKMLGRAELAKALSASVQRIRSEQSWQVT